MATWLVPQLTEAQVEAADPSTSGDLVYNSTNGTLMVAIPDDLDTPSGTKSYMTVGPTDTADGSITLAKLENGDGNEVLITDTSGVVERLVMGEATLLARDTGGNITAQKLQDSMIDDNTITYSKLADIAPGHLLGALANDDITESDVAVAAVSISDIQGASVTSSDAPPSDPKNNDLWFYAGAEAGDNARLYIYQDDVWVDAAPGIVNTNPGADGAPGATGPQGTSVVSIVIQDREPDDDIVIEFYSSEQQISDNFISSITIPLNDISIEGLPPLPEPESEAVNYVLNVPVTGSTTWEEADTAFSVAFQRDNGAYTVIERDVNGGAFDLDMDDFGLSGTTLSDAHTLSYIGFVLQAGDDYTYDTSTSTITITADTASVLTEDETFNLINFRATVS